MTHRDVAALNNTYERALVTMHKMPRVWSDYLDFLVGQRLVTRARRTFDSALRALPITQHDRLWPQYLVRVSFWHFLLCRLPSTLRLAWICSGFCEVCMTADLDPRLMSVKLKHRTQSRLDRAKHVGLSTRQDACSMPAAVFNGLPAGFRAEVRDAAAHPRGDGDARLPAVPEAGADAYGGIHRLPESQGARNAAARQDCRLG